MSEQHTIIIVVKNDGTMTSKVEGATGQKCTTLSAWVNQLGTVELDQHTEDFYKEDGQMVTTGS